MTAAATPLDWTGGPALAWVACAALLYWLGGRGRSPRTADRRRTAAFAAGLAAILIALDSPLDDLADQLFWAHMTQHVILITVAPPLLALARPWTRMWHGLPLRLRRPVARALVRDPGLAPLRGAAGFLAKPVPSWLLFNLTFLAWHLPALYDAALSSGPLHALQHLTFFATALLFWTRVIDSPPWRSPLSDLGRIAYMTSTLVLGWVLAIVLALAGSPLYSAYADQASRPGGISAFTDQQLAAGVMWVPGSIAYTVAIVVIAYRWLEPQAARPQLGVRKLARNP
jgi:cytochrome c oxidase assembly factor CtaG